ncbi:MAG: hypothetical protein B6245_11950 [Desulfobacteraceae bacterium 4572_88]|nr:MAG: hypothetical protein B6245_11950 [Desulfobacteraceae bacterium 4572_88]
MAGHKKGQGETIPANEDICRIIPGAAKEIILTFDMGGRISYVNESGMERIGYFDDEILTMNIGDIIPPDQLKTIKEELLYSHATGEEKSVLHEVEFIDRNLRLFPVEASASLIIRNGRPSDILIIARITDDNRKNEKHSAGKEGICSHIVENAEEMILIADETGNITYVNKTGEQFSGYSLEELRGTNISDLFPPRHIERIRKELLENGKTVISEDKFIDRNQKKFPVRLRSSWMMRDDKLWDILTVVRDISRQKRRERERLRKRKFESLTMLAGGIVDDLNNFLTGIMGNIDLARMNLNPDEKTHTMLSYAKEGCGNIRTLIRHFLTFSKGSTPVREIGLIGPFVMESVNSVLPEVNIRCDFFIPDKLWSVAFDKKQIKLAIRHLVLNANEAMPSGGQIQVKAENISITPGRKSDVLSMKEGNYVRISFQDRGIGISENDLGKIFDPYFSSKKMKSRRGRGLGLTTVYAIIKKHHGYIDVASKQGVGTSVCICLPISGKDIPDFSIFEESFFHRKDRILIMDDEELVIDVADQMLRQLGYDTEFSKNGEEAIEIYKKAMKSDQPFDVVILELHVKSGMGGREVMKELLKLDIHVKGIVSSDYSNDPEMTDFEKYGFEGVLEKPYTIGELSKTLEYIMVGKTVEIYLKDRKKEESEENG